MAVAIAEVMRPVASRKTEAGIRLGAELEKLRGERGLTQKQVSERLGMSEEGYRNYVKGYGRITRHTLPRWAAAFDTPIPEMAARIGLGLLTETNASGLREQLAALLPDASAVQMETTVRELAKLPPHLREKWFEMQRWVMTGLRSDTGN